MSGVLPITFFFSMVFWIGRVRLRARLRARVRDSTNPYPHPSEG